MEGLTRSSVFLSLIGILVVTVIVKAVNWVWLRPKILERRLRQQGLSGTCYRFFVGDLNDLASTRSKAMEKPINGFTNDYLSHVEPLRYQLMTKFGKEYFMWDGPKPLMVLSRPDLYKEALTKLQEFEKPKMNAIAHKLFPGFAGYHGERWAKHRKIINPAFHVEKLKLMLPAFCDSTTEMINKWEKIVAETGSGEIDAWPFMTTLSADVISRAGFGSSYEEGKRIFELLREQLGLGLSILQSVYIPGFRHIPTTTNRRFEEVTNEIQTLMEGIIKKRKDAIEAGEPAKPDLLGILMDSNLKETQQTTSNNKNQQQLGLSLQDVIDEGKLFYLGGQETTSLLLVWTLILLSKHQDWQAKARQEVLQTFGDNVPDFEGLSHLKTVTMIFYEVLRLYPPASYQNRIVHKDTKLGELSLPAGTQVNFQILFMHHDKEIWGEDAEEFKPDRFSEGISKATRGNIGFFPFGWGPRICIGEKFAMTEAKMVLAMILQRFSFELSPSYCHAPMTVIFMLQPQHGAPIILHRL